jgi:V/A-type H+-transporting ATPase subunit K
MTAEMGIALMQAGSFSVMALSAVGSGLGTHVAGAAAVTAWKLCYLQKKAAPFQLAVFMGAPLSQTIYGMILMIIMNQKAKAAIAKLATDPAGALAMASHWPLYLVGGLVVGISMGVSSWLMGKAAAGCCYSFAETHTGFTNNLLVLGIIETVSLFIFVFTIMILIM